MVIDSAPRNEFRIDHMVTLFVCVATLVEAVCSILREQPVVATDIVLYMLIAIGVCIYSGYQSAKRLTVTPGISCAGMIGTVATTLIAVAMAFLGKGSEYIILFIIPVMPVAYVFAAKMGRELYTCVLTGQGHPV